MGDDHHVCKWSVSSTDRRKTPPAQVAAGADHHVCKWSICTSWWMEYTTSARCKDQDQHQGKLKWDAATTCNYNHHTHPHPLTSTCPYTSCIDCCIRHSNGTHAGSDLVSGMVVVVACCCWIPLQLTLMLILTFAPCADGVFLPSLVQLLHLYMWWSAPATICTGGIYVYMCVCITLQECNYALLYAPICCCLPKWLPLVNGFKAPIGTAQASPYSVSTPKVK